LHKLPDLAEAAAKASALFNNGSRFFNRSRRMVPEVRFETKAMILQSACGLVEV
jgi:hypothetical protein